MKEYIIMQSARRQWFTNFGKRKGGDIIPVLYTFSINYNIVLVTCTVLNKLFSFFISFLPSQHSSCLICISPLDSGFSYKRICSWYFGHVRSFKEFLNLNVDQPPYWLHKVSSLYSHPFCVATAYWINQNIFIYSE